jgi:hypothetical protein
VEVIALVLAHPRDSDRTYRPLLSASCGFGAGAAKVTGETKKVSPKTVAGPPAKKRRTSRKAAAIAVDESVSSGSASNVATRPAMKLTGMSYMQQPKTILVRKHFQQTVHYGYVF